MNLSRICLGAIIFIAVSTFATGQKPPKAVLVDELGSADCSDLRARVDDFLRGVVERPAEIGFVITRGPSSKKVTLVHREELVRAQIESRKFEPSRIKFIRATDENELKIEFWRLPSSAGDFDLIHRDSDYSLPAVVRPFLLLQDDEYNESECYDLDESRIASLFLKDNQGSRLNIVFYAQSEKAANSKKRRILNSFVRIHKIGRGRIRTFFKISPLDPENPKPTEYWYLPPKKK